MELQWKANAQLSGYHAAWCVAHCPQQVRNIAAPLQEAAMELHSLCGQLNLDANRFWNQILTLAPVADTPRELAQRLMPRLGLTSGEQQTRLSACLTHCRSQFSQAYPNYLPDMALREGPLRSLWEAQGPGLLHMMGGFTEEQLIIGQAEVVLVQPIVGGMGQAHLTTNRVHIEALLTNTARELPETLRLAWLLAQLDFDRPVHSELLNTIRLHAVAGLAVLPSVLMAGHELSICHYSPELVQQAIEFWKLMIPSMEAHQLAIVVSTWWETYQAARPPWRVALAGLDQMLLQQN